MSSAGRTWSAIVALVLLPPLVMSAAGAAERVSLDGCVVAVDADQPSFVQYAVEDLRSYVQDLTGTAPRVLSAGDGSVEVAILVGAQCAKQVLGPDALFPEAAAGDEYLLKSVMQDGQLRLVAVGATAHGTKYAVTRLMKLLQVDGNSLFVDGPVDIRSTPAFGKRGMHFNGWAFGYPYTFRNWREQDWQRYLDILSYQGINLFYLWPFIEIMPVPLSAPDQAYLEECRRVVDYAQQKHGMEVWIMQCTNRVAQDRCGVEDPRYRPYWRPSQKDLNPGNPQHLQAILASREAMYRILDNVDGVCNIDSDPGAYPGSSLSDYLQVLRGCRALLDQYNVHGEQAKLINWMWFGWGLPPQRAFEAAHQKQTIECLQQELAEPWWLINGTFPYLPLCRELGVLEKTVLLPYSVIEGEPSYPSTNVQIDAIRSAFDEHIAHYPELAGVMGNVQTPLLQFPNVYFYTSCVWDLEYRQRTEKEVLSELATLLYPEQQTLIADAYLTLKESDPVRVSALAEELAAVVEQGRLGRPGVFGRKLFPDGRIVAQSLVLQLRLSAARESLLQRMQQGNVDPQACLQLLTDYIDAYLAWDTAHGWHALWGWGPWPLGTFTADPRFVQLSVHLNKSLGSEANLDTFYTQLASAPSLRSKYDERAIQEGCITPLKNAIVAARPIASLAQHATATASALPNPDRYPPSAANDGTLSTLYWPGALVENNTQWLQLTWDTPQVFDQVVVHFLQHPSMHGRTIHLQRETVPGTWESFATTLVPAEPAAAHSVATFTLQHPVTLDKVRIVNLLDLFEVEIR